MLFFQWIPTGCHYYFIRAICFSASTQHSITLKSLFSLKMSKTKAIQLLRTIFILLMWQIVVSFIFFSSNQMKFYPFHLMLFRTVIKCCVWEFLQRKLMENWSNFRVVFVFLLLPNLVLHFIFTFMNGHTQSNFYFSSRLFHIFRVFLEYMSRGKKIK